MDRAVVIDIRVVRAGSPEHEQALTLRAETFFRSHGGRTAAVGRDQPGADHVVAVADGVVVACGQGHIEGGAYHVTQMAVAPHRRRDGLGTALLETLLERAAHLGIAAVRLEARDDAVEFYRRHGFVEVSEPRIIGETGVLHVAMERS